MVAVLSAPRLLQSVAAVLIVAGLAFGIRAGFGDLLARPSLEQQTRTVAQQLRCPVCTGQSVAESDSTVANEMRAEIRQRLQAGEEPAAILASFEERYGAWIINHPPAKGWFVLVWAAPFLAAGAGAVVLARYLSRQRSADGPPTGPPDGPPGDTTGGTARHDGVRADVAERLKDYL